MPRQKFSPKEQTNIGKWKRFISEAAVRQKKSTALSDMCPEGRKMFEEYSVDPVIQIEFLVHFSTRIGGCEKCHDAFIKHLHLVVN